MSYLFEQYELHKKKFSPGVIWKAKCGYVVQKLKIDEFKAIAPKEKYITFVILESDNPTCDELGEGVKTSWSKEYMEDCYEPVFE